MAINKVYLRSGRTLESDECLTPKYAVEPLIKHLKARGFNKIWCPFDQAHSNYVKVLGEGFNVVNSHIYDGYDFFKTNTPSGIDCIVSNPPFSKKDKILERLYELEVPFAMLLPQNSLQSIKRVGMFIENGVEYLGFDKRICFYTNGNLEEIRFENHFASGYFCKEVLSNNLTFEKLNQRQEPY